MGYLLRKLFFMLALGAAVHAAAHPTDGDTAKYVTTRLAVTGTVEHALNLSVADLRQLPLVRQGGAKAGQLENLKGVRLRELLEQAVVVSRDHNDVKKMVVIATASDGYKVVFSWSELFNSPVGEGVLVYFEKDGQPLGDDEGRIAMVSSKDIRSGPRHVKWLQSIEVKKIAE